MSCISIYENVSVREVVEQEIGAAYQVISNAGNINGLPPVLRLVRSEGRVVLVSIDADRHFLMVVVGDGRREEITFTHTGTWDTTTPTSLYQHIQTAYPHPTPPQEAYNTCLEALKPTGFNLPAEEIAEIINLATQGEWALSVKTRNQSTPSWILLNQHKNKETIVTSSGPSFTRTAQEDSIPFTPSEEELSTLLEILTLAQCKKNLRNIQLNAGATISPTQRKEITSAIFKLDSTLDKKKREIRKAIKTKVHEGLISNYRKRKNRQTQNEAFNLLNRMSNKKPQ